MAAHPSDKNPIRRADLTDKAQRYRWKNAATGCVKQHSQTCPGAERPVAAKSRRLRVHEVDKFHRCCREL